MAFVFGRQFIVTWDLAQGACLLSLRSAQNLMGCGNAALTKSAPGYTTEPFRFGVRNRSLRVPAESLQCRGTYSRYPFQPSRRWQQFFIKIKKPHLCFHCLRVTYVNRLRRAGVPREAAMRLVNHASELIHQVYQREKVEDVAQWRDAVSFPQVAVVGAPIGRD